MSGGMIQLVERGTGRVVVSSLQVADNPWRRFVGWQFCRLPPPGHGLLLTHCRSIHTCWMRFTIDAVALDGAGRVLEVRRSIRPWWTAILPTKTHAVLEVPTCTVAIEMGVELGVEFDGELPASLRFLAR